jgi:hypothetical protein
MGALTDLRQCDILLRAVPLVRDRMQFDQLKRL